MFRKLILFLFLLMILAACSRDDADRAFAVDMGPQAAYAPGFAFADAAVGGSYFGHEPQAPAQRLIIQTANVQLETEYFDDAVDSLRDIPSAFGGYSQSESLFTSFGQRQFEIVMRIPAAEFDNTLARIHQIAYARSLNVSAEDVTDRFYDIDSRLETRLIEKDRILALIDQTTRLEDLLELESRLAATRLQIDRYTAALADLESQISYSTIHVHLFDIEDVQEVVAIASFGERVGGAFGSSIDGTISVIQFIIVVLAGAIIPTALILLIVALIIMLRRKKTRKLSLMTK